MHLSGNAGPPLDGRLDRAEAGGVLNELESGAHGGGRGSATPHVKPR